MEEKIKVAIAGVTGYTGAELVRILSLHPKVQIHQLFASREGTLWEFLPNLRKIIPDAKVEKFSPEKVEADVFFSCLPHGEFHKVADKVKSRLIIDLSADFRLPPDIWEKTYGQKHLTPSLFESSAYGLTEVARREIKNARIVANPGCYPTALLLALAPLLSEYPDALDEVFADAKSGMTGAGRKPSEKTFFGNLSENFFVYSAFAHRHVPEMEFWAEKFFHAKLKINFCAQLIPAKRGILITIWAKLKAKISEDKMFEIYERFGNSEKFFDFTGDRLPDILSVSGTNLCRVGLKIKDGTLLVVSAIDNLVKGASGQAVQNMNTALGFDETEGLEKLTPLSV